MEWVIVITKWKSVVGFEGLYEVSNNGDVRNVRTGHILSPGVSQGYHYVALYDNGIRKNKQVHRLVAEAFIPNQNGCPIINHKDENKINNTVDNLEWCSHHYNNTYNNIVARRSESQRGKPAWNKGKTMPESFRQKVSAGMKNFYRGRSSDNR